MWRLLLAYTAWSWCNDWTLLKLLGWNAKSCYKESIAWSVFATSSVKLARRVTSKVDSGGEQAQDLPY